VAAEQVQQLLFLTTCPNREVPWQLGAMW
jgi:hypothetical protein